MGHRRVYLAQVTLVQILIERECEEVDYIWMLTNDIQSLSFIFANVAANSSFPTFFRGQF